MRRETKDLTDFFTQVADHTCQARTITSKDVQGTSIYDTFLGFECTCGVHFVLSLLYVKCTPKPMRPYLTTREGRIRTAGRLTDEPAKALYEMRNSGGWFQPDPGVTMMTLAAAAMGPPGNPMEKKLNQLVEGRDKPS